MRRIPFVLIGWLVGLGCGLALAQTPSPTAGPTSTAVPTLPVDVETPAASDSPPDASLPPLISKVILEVDGPYSERQLRLALVIREGRRLFPADVTASLRNLWLLGYFLPDIRVFAEGPHEATTVRIRMERHPFVSRIRVHSGAWLLPLPRFRWLFPSKPRLTRRQLIRALTLRRGSNFKEEELQKSLANLRDLLERNGFYEATVEARTQTKEKSVRIDIDIEPGPPAILSQIQFMVPGLNDKQLEAAKQEVSDMVGSRYERRRMVQKLDQLRRRFELRGYFRPTLALQDVQFKPPQSVVAVVSIDPGPKMQLEVRRSDPKTPLPRSWFLADWPLYESVWSRLFGNVYAKLLPIWDDRSIDLPTLQRSEANLERYYRGRGYAQAQVTATKALGSKTNRATVQIDIEAGPSFHIRSLELEGNLALTSKEILKALESEEGKAYDPDAVSEDLKRIRALYRRQGFHAAQAVSQQIIGASEVDLKLIITEGIQSRIGSVRIEGYSILRSEELFAQLPFHAGDPFVPDQVVDGQYRLFSLYNDRGFSSTVVEIAGPLPLQRTVLDPPWPEKVEIYYRIYEGEGAIFGPTILKGLDRSHRWVVLKELTFRRGDAFDLEKLYESANRVRRLGLFNVKHFNRIEDEGALKTILIDVEEIPAGTVGLGFGFTGRSEGATLGFLPLNKASADLLYRNLGGYGALIGLAAEVGFDRRQYRLKLGHPHLGAEDLTLDLSLSSDDEQKTLTVRGNRTEYDSHTLGGTLSVGRRFGETMRLGLSYRYNDRTISNLEVGEYVKNEDIDTEVISSITAGFSLDSRDFPFNPTKGLLGQVALEVARKELRSENNFTKFIAQVNDYRQLRRGHVLATGLRLGLAKALPYGERFTLGGYGTLKGFEDPIGADSTDRPPLPPGTLPEDVEIAVGGNAQILYNIEYRFPLFFGLGAQTWADLGNVWSTTSEFKPWNVKTGLGAGLRYDTPIGPLRFDLGWGFNESFQREGWDYYIAIGHPF